MDSMAPRNETLNILEIAADAALDKLGKDLVAVDLTEQMVLSEVFFNSYWPKRAANRCNC